MKRFKEGDPQEDANKILVHHPPFQIKAIHPRRFGITKDSLNLQSVKKRKFCIWELDTFSTIINNKILKLLMKEMKLTKIIQKLNLNSKYHHDITNLGLSYLSNSFKNLLTMKEITLDFYYRKGVSHEGLENISKGLKKLRFLKKAHIDFVSCFPIHPTGFEILGRPLKTLRFLKTLRVDFGPCFLFMEKKNQGLKRILEALKCCHYLRNICLSFNLNDGAFEVFSGVLKKLASLRNVYLELEESNITDNGLLCICKDVKRLGFLKILHLDLYGCQQITDEGIRRAKERFSEENFSIGEIMISKGPGRKLEDRKRFI